MKLLKELTTTPPLLAVLLVLAGGYGDVDDVWVKVVIFPFLVVLSIIIGQRIDRGESKGRHR